MSEEPGQTPPPGPGGEEQQLSPEQEQMLRQMEEEMRRVRVEDLIAQSVVSILNLSARRILKDDERDLEQARIGIEAVRALVDQLDEESQREIKNALSQIQVLYARHAEAEAEGTPPPSAGPTQPLAQDPNPGIQKPGLWVPGSD